jgi:CRP/FNR family transcriptional regulator, cyclic AMP receptor protein
MTTTTAGTNTTSEEALAGIDLFDSLDGVDRQALAALCHERRFAAQHHLFDEGDEGDGVYIVRDGSISIRRLRGSQSILLATLGQHHMLGEMSLFDSSKRSATAIANVDSVVWHIERSAWLGFLEQRPKVAVLLIGELAQRLRQTNDLFSTQVSRDVLEDHDDERSLGARVADRVASFGGSWTFIFVFLGSMVLWMGTNLLLHADSAFDPYPFILLNLVLSSTAALQAPIIMMSQNRQAQKDKLLAQNDYQVNLKTELGVEQLLLLQADLLARVQRLEARSAPVQDTKHQGVIEANDVR